MELLAEILKNQPEITEWWEHSAQPRVTPLVRQPLKDNFKAKLDSSEMSAEKDREVSLPQF